MNARKRSSSERHLVTEQPGMAILISGFILSFFIGYVTKSLYSPARVSAQIEKAASHIHKDVKVSFSSAQISFNDGIFSTPCGDHLSRAHGVFASLLGSSRLGSG